MGEQDLLQLAALLKEYPDDLRRALAIESGTGDARSQAQALLSTERVKRALAEADDTQRAFLAFIAHMGGRSTPAAADWWLRHRGIEDPHQFVDDLAARGLVFYATTRARLQTADLAVTRAQRGLRIEGKLWLPDAIGRQVIQLQPMKRLAGAEAPAEVLTADPGEIFRRLFLLVRYLEKQPPPLSGLPGRLRRSERSGLSELLGIALSRNPVAGADEQLLWLERVALQAGIADEVDGRLVAAPEALSFFEQSPQEQRRKLLEAAICQTGWLELEGLPRLSVQPSSPATAAQSDVPSPGKYIRARRHVLKIVTQTVVPEQWHRVADLAERVMEQAPDFLVRRRLPPWSQLSPGGCYPTYRGLFLETNGDASLPPRRGSLRPLCMLRDWMAVEGAFVHRFLLGPLHWLGLIDVGGSADECFFRLTPIGAETLGLHVQEPKPPTSARFVVQPDFEIVVPAGGESIAAIACLSRVADLISFDRAALLKITQESVTRALESGLPCADILKILGDDGHVALPQNVEYSIKDWAAAYNRYELRSNADVVEAEDPAELDALMEALPGCLDRLGPTAAIVRPGKIEEVSQALASRQDVLQIDHEQGLSNVFTLDEAMIARPIRNRWHWYAEHLLSQIADRVTGKTVAFRLTPSSVQGALARGFTAEEVERFIRACATKDLTAEQQFVLRGWLGRYSSAQLSPAVVLALPPEAVADALAIPEIRSQIVAPLSPTHFTVRQKGLGKIRRLLRRAGIEVQTHLKNGPSSWFPPEHDAKCGSLADDARMLDATADSPTGPLSEGPHEEEPKIFSQSPGRSEGHAAPWGNRRWKRGDAPEEQLALLKDAIDRGRRVAVEYASVAAERPPVHWVVTPQSIVRSRWGQMRLHAHCHVRGTQRIFDLSRVIGLTLLDEERAD